MLQAANLAGSAAVDFQIVVSNVPNCALWEFKRKFYSFCCLHAIQTFLKLPVGKLTKLQVEQLIEFIGCEFLRSQMTIPAVISVEVIGRILHFLMFCANETSTSVRHF